MTDKTIDTLVTDIYNVLNESNTSITVNTTLNMERPVPEVRNYRASSIGTPCARKFWYKMNKPELAEPFDPEVLNKFNYGNLIEEYILELARTAGHTVSHEQYEVNIPPVKGHLDAIIDGVLIDVKSCSSKSFHDFKQGLSVFTDKFGYLTQLKIYLYAARQCIEGIATNTAAFLAIDKVSGEIHLDTHTFSNAELEGVADFVNYRVEIAEYEEPPHRPYIPVPDGKSGNTTLAVECSYCEFKETCWPLARKFKYASGVKYLVDVVRVPNVIEVT